MKERDYVAIFVRTDPRYCTVEKLGDLQYPGDLTKATSMASGFPRRLKVDLSKRGGDMITDFVNNIFSILIVSGKARGALEAAGVSGDQVEYLPIVLRDRKRTPIKEPFYIVNLLRTVDCFDWKRSVYETYPGTREISPASLEILHVVPKQIPADAKLFRLGELREELIIRTDLLEDLKRQGCEGLCVVPMGEERI